MFIQVWTKYLPVIKILLKRSANSEQTLDMNSTDFIRAAGGRKVKFTFSIGFRKGKIFETINQPALALEIAGVLLQDDMIRGLLRQNDYKLSMNSKFQLTIINCTPPPEPEAEITTNATENEEAETH